MPSAGSLLNVPQEFTPACPCEVSMPTATKCHLSLPVGGTVSFSSFCFSRFQHSLSPSRPSLWVPWDLHPALPHFLFLKFLPHSRLICPSRSFPYHPLKVFAPQVPVSLLVRVAPTPLVTLPSPSISFLSLSLPVGHSSCLVGKEV